MKLKLMTLTLLIASFANSSFAKTIDLSNGYNGESSRKFLKTIKNGKSISFNFAGNRSQYVESILIAAIGKQRAYSFGKVFADGEEIATLGVPGRDPLYPIVVRGKVSTIEVFATDGSKFKVTDFKIYTGRKDYSSYSAKGRHFLNNYSVENWGSDVVNVLFELDRLYSLSTSPNKSLFADLKRKAMKVSASERARNERSLKTFRKVATLLDVVEEVEEVLLSNEDLLLSYEATFLITDLLTIKEDILERYDLDL